MAQVRVRVLDGRSVLLGNSVYKPGAEFNIDSVDIEHLVGKVVELLPDQAREEGQGYSREFLVGRLAEMGIRAAKGTNLRYLTKMYERALRGE